MARWRSGKGDVEMDKTAMFEEKLISDLAKGRFPKAKVKHIIEVFCRESARKAERNTFEFCWLFCLQTLAYEFGFGKDRLQRFFDEASKAVDAFDAGAYDLEDMRQSLKDKKFECSFDLGVE